MILVFKSFDNVFFIDKDSNPSNHFPKYQGLINYHHLHFSFKPDGSMDYSDYVEFAYQFDTLQPKLYFDLYINALDFFIERNVEIESFTFLFPSNPSLDMLVEYHNTIDLFFKEIKDKYLLLPVHLRKYIMEVAYAKN